MQPFTWLARTHLLSAAGDALIAIALAGSLFFSLDPAAARPRVALYLVVTMAPFAVVGPLIGPLVDRSRGGRRGMIIGAGIARAVLALLMVRHLDSLLLFPEAFGALVAGKTYHVAKSAVVPGLVREERDLVEANSKLMLLSGLGGGLAVGPGLLLSWASSRWVLVLASVVFVLMTFPAARLPRTAVRPQSRLASELSSDGLNQPPPPGQSPQLGQLPPPVQSPQLGQLPPPGQLLPPGQSLPPGQLPQPGQSLPLGQLPQPDQRHGPPQSRLPDQPAHVSRRRGAMLLAGSAMGVVRAMTGFTLFLIAFWLRTDDAAPLWFGFMFIASAVGQLIGAVSAPVLRRRIREEMLLASTLALAAAMSFYVVTSPDRASVLFLAVVIGLMSALGKLCFDAIVQRDEVPAERGRTFARFETRFQLMWVIGALVPVAAPSGILPLRAGVTLLGIAATVAVLLYAGGMWALARGRRPPSQIIATRVRTRIVQTRVRSRDRRNRDL
ncbi:MFS transporter [Candidatus Poriferisodalis sp.]|uniref:MFS transporter n=1 Tax=Candidatus Poriferisodalis sp. TaxID=3101277 RepID=UPI003B529870